MTSRARVRRTTTLASRREHDQWALGKETVHVGLSARAMRYSVSSIIPPNRLTAAYLSRAPSLSRELARMLCASQDGYVKMNRGLLTLFIVGHGAKSKLEGRQSAENDSGCPRRTTWSPKSSPKGTPRVQNVSK
jgi:hypothetical protein